MTENKHTVLRIPGLDMEARLVPNRIALYEGKIGYANGYVGVQKGHPFYGIDYNELFDKVSVHGGLTFSGYVDAFTSYEGELKDYWWIGFDTHHTGDTLWGADKDYCLEQLVSLSCQIATFIERYDYDED